MAQCTNPFVKDGMSLPCGKCYNCLARRVSGWSFRLMKEAEVSTSAFFVTFTYDDAHVPRTANGFMTLHKPDMQNFFKRFRKAEGKSGIKYYLCGEYGTNYERPHYHVILFNSDLKNLIGKTYATQVQMGNIILDGKAQYYCDSWRDNDGNYIGHITVGTVSNASVGYTMQYISKPNIIPKHQRDDRVKEFSLMSKGLGKSYLTPQMIAWHKSDLGNRYYIPLLDDKKIAVPRYFKERIYTQSERMGIGEHLKNEAITEFYKKDLSTRYEDMKKNDLIRIDQIRKLATAKRKDGLE